MPRLGLHRLRQPRDPLARLPLQRRQQPRDGLDPMPPPRGLDERLRERLGKRFELRHDLLPILDLHAGLVPCQRLVLGLSQARREGEAPAEPRARGRVHLQSRLGRSLALPREADPKIKPWRATGPTPRHTAPRTAPAWPTPLQVSKTPEETIPHNVRLGEESRTVEVEVVRTESILFYVESSLPRTGCREFKYDSNSTCAASISSFFFRCFRDRSSSIKWSITTAVVQRSSCRAMGRPNCS